MLTAMTEELSEYERQRLENIRRNNAVLADLHLGPGYLNVKSNAEPGQNKRKATPSVARKPPKKKVEETPRRTSLRLRGIKADSVLAEERREEERRQSLAAERERKAELRRKGGEFSIADMLGDKGISEDGCRDLATTLKTVSSSSPSSRRRTEADREEDECASERPVPDTELSCRLRKLTLRHGPVKVVPERIYSQAFHPSATSHLLAVGDKAGYLGFWKIGEDDSEADASPQVWAIKPHSRSITCMLFSHAEPTTLFTSSYDGTVRQLDLMTSKSTEAFFFDGTDGSEIGSEVADEENTGITSLAVPRDSPTSLWFSDTAGRVGRRDLRARKGRAALFQLSEKKIGCVSVTNDGVHFVTSSLDQTMKIWDARNLKAAPADAFEKGGTPVIPEAAWEWQHGLSVTAAYWSPSNDRIVSTSYDNKLRIFADPRETGELRKPISIPHNNQTGRWVTVLRSVWHPDPDLPLIITGNMKRGIDVHDAETGDALAYLHDPERISAVPAVVCAHPSTLAIAGGNASGRVVLFS